MRDTYVTLRDSYGTPEMREIWTEENMVQKWLDFEKAIALEEAEFGLVPKEVADDIASKCTLQHLTPEMVAQYKSETGHLIVSFIKAFAAMAGPSGEYFHLGPTTQDILDTGFICQSREAYNILMKDLLKLEEALLNHAREHRSTVMMGRTHAQHGVPITWGFKCANWASEIRDHIERMKEMEKRLFVMKLTAAMGSRNTFMYLTGSAEKTQELCERIAARMGLPYPVWDPTGRFDRFSELATNLAMINSGLGAMGLEIRWMQGTEVDEVKEPWDPKKTYSSSTMPGKINPEPDEWHEGVAKMARGNALAVMDIHMQTQRDATRMGPQLACIPENFLLCHSAVRRATKIFSGLEVHTDKMRQNMYILQGSPLGEAVMLKLWQKTGKKVSAHTMVHDATTTAIQQNKLFRDALLEMPEVRDVLSAEEIDEVTEPANYIGTAPEQADAIVDYIEKKRKEDKKYME